jgi:DNA-binding MarR family transcriptional regulator
MTKQAGKPGVPDATTASRLHAVAIHLLRHARAADAASGLSAARLSALSVLVFGGARTVTELAEAEQVSTPTMTRLLQRLEADGHVRRRRDPRDRRVVQISATARGRRVLQAARTARVALIDGIMERVPVSDRRVVDRAVSVLERALRDVLRPAPARAPASARPERRQRSR